MYILKLRKQLYCARTVGSTFDRRLPIGCFFWCFFYFEKRHTLDYHEKKPASVSQPNVYNHFNPSKCDISILHTSFLHPLLPYAIFAIGIRSWK